MNKHLKTTFGLGLGLGALALPGTAFAQAWSHSSIRSFSAEAARGTGTANAGFTVSGEGQQGAGAQAGGGRSTQGNTIWAKIKANTYTVASLRATASSNAVWGVSQSANTSLNATLFGQNVLNRSCSAAPFCESKSVNQMTQNISPELVVWSDPSGLARLTAQLRGTMGYNFTAQANSRPLGGFADMSTFANNSANGSVGLAIRGVVGFSWINVGVGVVMDVAKMTFSAPVNDRMVVNSRKDLDLTWGNTAGLLFSSAGGKAIAGVCVPIAGCLEKTLFSWPGFTRNMPIYAPAYADNGTLSNQSF
jgi:hypothetical protein